MKPKQEGHSDESRVSSLLLIRPALTALVGFLGVLGCGHQLTPVVQTPLAPEVRAQLGTIGVVRVDCDPSLKYDEPVKGAWKGAGRGQARRSMAGFRAIKAQTQGRSYGLPRVTVVGLPRTVPPDEDEPLREFRYQGVARDGAATLMELWYPIPLLTIQRTGRRINPDLGLTMPFASRLLRAADNSLLCWSTEEREEVQELSPPHTGHANMA